MTLQEFLSKFDTINVREYRRDNQKWTIQRNWQHSVHKINKRQRIPKGQSKMDNPEKLATQCMYTRQTKQTHNTLQEMYKAYLIIPFENIS